MADGTKWEYAELRTTAVPGSSHREVLFVEAAKSSPRPLETTDVAALASLGSERWELVAVVPDRDDTWRYLFKRPHIGRGSLRG